MRAILIGLMLCVSLATVSHAAPATPTTEAWSVQEGVYIGRVSTTMSLLAASIGRFTDSVSNARPSDRSWQSATSAEPRMWEALFDEFATIEPPARFADLHESVFNAVEAMAFAADDCVNGIDNLDVPAIDACTDGVRTATALMALVEMPVMPVAP